jgi:hypothetical protein
MPIKEATLCKIDGNFSNMNFAKGTSWEGGMTYVAIYLAFQQPWNSGPGYTPLKIQYKNANNFLVDVPGLDNITGNVQTFINLPPSEIYIVYDPTNISGAASGMPLNVTFQKLD